MKKLLCMVVCLAVLATTMMATATALTADPTQQSIPASSKHSDRALLQDAAEVNQTQDASKATTVETPATEQQGGTDTAEEVAPFTIVEKDIPALVTALRKAAAEGETFEQDFVLPEDCDPLLTLWHDFVITGEQETSSIVYRPQDYPSGWVIPAIGFNGRYDWKPVQQEILMYLRSLNVTFVGVREMSENFKRPTVPQWQDDVLRVSYTEGMNEGKGGGTADKEIHCLVRADGTFVVQDIARGLELYTEAGAVNPAEYREVLLWYMRTYSYDLFGIDY